MLNKRTLIDVNLTQTLALPAAGTTATSAVLDLVSLNPGRIPGVELFINTSAAPAALADGHNVTFTIQHSADSVNWTSEGDLPSYTLTGAGVAGAAALAAQVALPISLNRYVRLAITEDANGGNLTAITATFGLVF